MVSALLLLLMGGGFEAQDIATYPTVRNPEKFSTDWRVFYERADTLTAEARRSLPHQLNVPYGPESKQKLDVYMPSAGSGPWPVFVFLHGGGFREGDRAHYGFIASPLAASGTVAVIASYRLHPHRYPDQVVDTRLVLAWVHRHISAHRGDPARVFIGGHSAGAILAALAGVQTVWPDALDLPPDFVKGIVPVSGPYDLRTAKGFVDDFVTGTAEREAASPLLNIGRTPPALVVLGSREPAFLNSSRLFVEALRERGGTAELLVLEEMGHDGTALAFGDPEGPLFQRIRLMISSSTTSDGSHPWNREGR